MKIMLVVLFINIITCHL